MNSKPPAPASEPSVPPDFHKALAGAPKAKVQWQDLTPIARRDFVSWIASAKQAETRARRIQVACSKLIAGQRRPCCYAIVPMKLYQALTATPKAKTQWSTLTPTERRDFIDWIDAAKAPDEHGRRIKKACAMLASGKRWP